jgi:hypothetical protein
LSAAAAFADGCSSAASGLVTAAAAAT